MDCRDDKGLRELQAEYGYHQAYALWFMILEEVCKEFKQTGRPEATLTVSEWCQRLKINRLKLAQYSVSAEFRLSIETVLNESKLTIKIPNLLKIRDNHTKLGQVTSKKLSPKNKEVRIKSKDIKHKDKKSSPKFCEFADAWSQYPAKIGRKESERHYKATVKDQETHDRLMTALQKYKDFVEGDGRPWMNGKTWFNNWHDWIEFEPPPKVAGNNGKRVLTNELTETERRIMEESTYGKE